MTQPPDAQRLKPLLGGSVLALDGDVGAISDFYFDDDSWTVRYIVVDTGRWLRGRQVLVPLWALHAPDWQQARVPVRITRKQVRHSPDIDTHRPVSRRMEAAALSYYRYPAYWAGPALWGHVPAPEPTTGIASPDPDALQDTDERGTHLRSVREVTGYHIRARDGDIGHVDDFLINPDTWAIGHLLIDTSNWIGGRAALISRSDVTRVSWPDHVVEVSLSRDAVARSPEPTRA
jgi:uncharacterized protein YrrD